MSALPTIGFGPHGRVSLKFAEGSEFSTHSAEAILLCMILDRLPDPNCPLPEAIEWEMLDGTERTTDIKVARNWANAVGVRVVRRATGSQP